MFYFNPMYLLLLIPTLLVWYTQARVRQVFTKYQMIPNRQDTSGLEVTKSLFSHQGLTSVAVEQTHGTPTDHYAPQSRRLRLSETVMNNGSVTSLEPLFA